MTAATHPATTAKKKPEAGPPASGLDLESIGDLSRPSQPARDRREKFPAAGTAPGPDR
jgi:hypothetical protein